MNLFPHQVDLHAPKAEGEVELTPLQLTRLRFSAQRFQNFVIAALFATIIGNGFGVWSLHRNDQRIESVRQQRTVASCQQSNRHDRELIGKMAEANGLAADAPLVTAFLAGLRRDCSLAGIRAYFANTPPDEPCTDDGTGFCVAPTSP